MRRNTDKQFIIVTKQLLQQLKTQHSVELINGNDFDITMYNLKSTF